MTTGDMPAGMQGTPAEINDEVAALVRLAGTRGHIVPLDAARLARVRTAVHGAWRTEIEFVARHARQVKTRRRWLAIAVPLVVAASAVITFAIWRPGRTPAAVPSPALVAHIDYATGSSTPFTAGGTVMSGSTVTTSAGTLALTLTSGVHLRLDASSAIRVDSAADVVLERGAVYVDSAPANPGVDPSAGTPAPRLPGASPITIHTPAGLVRDIGTQFEVRLADAGIRVRVREGEVRVTYANGVEALAGAGEELFTRPDGSIDRRPVAETGSEWEWAERAAPPFAVEGKTLGALLDWVSHEGAWTVTFADSRTSDALRATLVHGRPDLLKGLTPAEALDVVLPTCGLRHRIDGRRVVIEADRATRAGGRR